MLKSLLIDTLGYDAVPDHESVESARFVATCASILLAGSIILPFVSGLIPAYTVGLIGLMLILALFALYLLRWVWAEYDSCIAISSAKPNALMLSQIGGFPIALIALACAIPLRSFILNASLGAGVATVANAAVLLVTYLMVKFYNSRILRFG